MKPEQTIAEFDRFLDARKLTLDAVVVGGAALALLGVITRETRDCDVLYPQLPDDVRDAARDFAEVRRAAGDALEDDWLNNGPASLADALPEGWLDRLQPAYSGRAITLRSLGRLDLLRSKLFALCDRGLDLADCVALAPTAEELAIVLPWLELQDANHGWPVHVREVFNDLRQRFGHGV